MPPLEDLAATLREHLWRAGVRRADLHEVRDTTKRVTLYDLRSTGITWEVLAGTEALKIQQRAGHTQFSTTQGYIRTAEELGARVGAPFPPIPSELRGPASGPGQLPSDAIQHQLGSEMRRPQRDLKPKTAETSDHDERISRESDTGSATKAHDEGSLSRRFGSDDDPLEAALGEAILRASRDGRHDLLPLLIDELKARRLERQRKARDAGVVDLNAERERRGR